MSSTGRPGSASRRYGYRPSRNTARLKSGVVARMHHTLFSETKLKSFAALLDAEDLSVDELRALRRMVNAKLREHTALSGSVSRSGQRAPDGPRK